MPAVDEIVDGLNALPEDVSKVLGSSQETVFNVELRERLKLSDTASKLMNAFYLSLLFKKVSTKDLMPFLQEQLEIHDQNTLKYLLEHFVTRLYQYGDYFPDIQSFALTQAVALPQYPPLIESVREVNAPQVGFLKAKGDEQITIVLLDALAKYPRINDQQVTDERIKVKSEKEPVRPTVRNWLRAYRDVLGVRRHTAIERGQFIFSSENTKKLSSAERDRLVTLFKSLDENEPLSIDPARQEIVFPVRPIAQQQPRASVAPVEKRQEAQPLNVIRPTTSADQPPSSLASVVAPQSVLRTQPSLEPQSISFSSGHTLPAERAVSVESPLSRVPSAPRHNFSSQNSPRLSVERPMASAQPVAPAKKEVWQIPAGLANVVDLRSGDE